MPDRPHEAADTATTCRAAVELETSARDAEVALGHLLAIQVDMPSVDVAVRLARSQHVDSRQALPSAGASFGRVMITPLPPRAALLALPPTPVDDTPSGSLHQPQDLAPFILTSCNGVAEFGFDAAVEHVITLHDIAR